MSNFTQEQDGLQRAPASRSVVNKVLAVETPEVSKLFDGSQ